MQINLVHIVIFLILLGLNISCIEKYSPKIEDFENQLVVDGLITNLNEPYIVRLSKTSPLDKPGIVPFEGAIVEVEDNNQDLFQFNEKSPGIYQNNTFTGQIGNSYQLHIITPDGKEYRSNFQELASAVPIDTVYAEIEQKPTIDPDYDEVGYQFYVATHDSTNTQTYYLWQLEEDYEYHADYPLSFIYQNGMMERYPSPMEFKKCWSNKKIEDVFLFDASVLNSVDLEKFPLSFVNTETKKLSVRYSLLTNQYAINSATYDFFKSVQEMNSCGDLFNSTQPYQIQGNIECISDPDEKVMGLFWAAGKASKRIYVNRPYGVPFYYERCSPNPEGLPGYPMYGVTLYITRGDNGELGVVNRECVDCRANGGSTVKPDFWVDQ